jgi:hypothetical protein
MVVEKQTDNSNLPDIDIQSGLLITTKERVNIFWMSRKNNFFKNIRPVHLFFQIFLIANLF